MPGKLRTSVMIDGFLKDKATVAAELSSVEQILSAFYVETYCCQISETRFVNII